MLRSALPRPLIYRYYSKTSRWHIEPSPYYRNVRSDHEGQAAETVKRDTQDGQDSSPTSLPSETTAESSSSGSQQNLSNTYDIEMAKTRFREWTEQAAIAMRHHADDFTVKSKATFSQLGAQLNKVTGYEEIEALKRGVVEQEQRVNASRQVAREAKRAYEEAVVQRADSQREVNDLLQRKTTWTAADVARFTSLVPQDHQLQQQEVQAKTIVDGAEEAVEKEFSQLMRLILARYHEEQVWSDKIRSASTYGSLVALGLNMLVFISAILVVEPWKRRRLTQTFEDKIMELSRENGKRLNESEQVLTSQIQEQTVLLQNLKETLSKNIEANVLGGIIVTEDSSQVILEPEPDVGPRPWLSKRRTEIAIGIGAFTVGLLSSMLFR